MLSDITTAVAYVLKWGGTRSKGLLAPASQLLTWAEWNVSKNFLADLLSRRNVLEAEWSLNQEVFLMVTEARGQPQIDLFASQQNTKVQMFFSLHREDQAVGIDAFAHPWDYSPLGTDPTGPEEIQRQKHKSDPVTPPLLAEEALVCSSAKSSCNLCGSYHSERIC